LKKRYFRSQKPEVKNREYMKSNKAVSLVELAIVLTVIGLLVAAVTAGVSIRKSSELRSFMTQITGFQLAIEGFDNKYSDLPGDMSDAFTYWGGTLCSASSTASQCNGDSDSRIENGPGTSAGTNEIDVSVAADIESYRAWQHLVLSEFLDGGYSGVGGGAVIGINIPESKRIKVGYTIAFNATRARNEIMLGAFNATANALNTNAALTPIEALTIDKKNDDGAPSTGLVYGIDGLDVTATNCVTGGAYNIAIANASCVVIFPAR
jgi:type II secretory pathway pseudopilin PulG